MNSQRKKKIPYNSVLVNKPFKQPTRGKTLADAEFPDDFKELSQNSKRQKVENRAKSGNAMYTENKMKPVNGLLTDDRIKHDYRVKEDDIPKNGPDTRMGNKPKTEHKMKTDLEKNTGSELKLGKDTKANDTISFKNGLIPQEDLMEDDFDFTQAADEIDQIEIAASQMMSTKPTLKQIDHSKQKCSKNSDILDELLSGKSKNFPQNVCEENFHLKLPKKKTVPVERLKSGECSNAGVPDKDHELKILSEKRKYDTFQGIQQNSDVEKRQKEMKLKKDSDNLELLNTYKTKMVEAEKKYLSKDGEIKILRESLRKLSEDERKYKEKIQGLEHDLKTKQSEKEARLIAEVEKLRTQLTFKEKEVQDALEKHKKNSVLITSSPRTVPTHKKSAKVGFYSDAFEKSERNDKTPALLHKNKNIIPYSSYFQSKSFKGILRSNVLELSPSQKIVECFDYPIGSYEKLRLNCNHGIIDTIEKDVTDFPSDVRSLLELVNIDGFFIPEFVQKVNICLKRMYDILSAGTNNNVQDENSNGNLAKNEQESDNIGTKECLYCETAYKNGLCCLSFLRHIPPAIKKYLLKGLSKYVGKELETPPVKNIDVVVDNKKYYLKFSNDSNFIIVRDKANAETTLCKPNSENTKYEVAIIFWNTISQLMLLESPKEIEKLVFKFHISLPFYPLKTLSETHCLYLMENQLITKYLNLITVERILDVMEMLPKFIGLKSVIKLICNKSDHCPLLLIYNWLINEDQLKNTKILQVFQELISFLSSIIAFDQTLAYNCLLESECRCSNEIIEFLITFLFDEFKYLQKEVFLSIGSALNSKVLSRLTCFRQGMSLLSLICVNEKNLCDKRSAVEWNYIYLLVGTIKMYRKIPSINDKEVLDLEDLLDMDQYIDIDVPPEQMEAETTINANEVIVVE